MTVFHWLVVLVLVLAFLMHGERKHNLPYIAIAVALMFCVYGFRDAYSVGIDTTSSYLHHFEEMKEMPEENLPDFSDWLGTADKDADEREGHSRHFFFEWLMKLGYDWTDGDYQLFISLICLFNMVIFARFVFRYSPSPVQSLLLYFGLLFYTFNFSALKQSIAMTFILLAADAVIDRKLIRFLILTALASMFHFPALVILPAYWIAGMKPGKSYLLLLAAAFVLTYLIRDQMVDWMTDTYETMIYDSNRSFLSNKVLIMIVILAVAIVIRPPDGEDKEYTAFLLLMGIATVIQTFTTYNNTFERLADYYFQFSVVFIPMVFEKVKIKRRYIGESELSMVCKIGPYLFSVFAIWRFLEYVSRSGTGLIPYQFFFQVKDTPMEVLFMWRVL